MTSIQEAVVHYLQRQKLAAVAGDRSQARVYPTLVVNTELTGSVLLAGGQLAEHTYQVRILAAADRERRGTPTLLSALVGPLLRGIPWGDRTLHPLHIRSEEDTLHFDVSVCLPVPEDPETDTEAFRHMEELHLSV